jgi:hypothetical protein
MKLILTTILFATGMADSALAQKDAPNIVTDGLAAY